MLHLQSRRLLKPLVQLLLCSSNRCGQWKAVNCGKSCTTSLLSSRWQVAGSKQPPIAPGLQRLALALQTQHLDVAVALQSRRVDHRRVGAAEPRRRRLGRRLGRALVGDGDRRLRLGRLLRLGLAVRVGGSGSGCSWGWGWG